jgi:hypothetical protein
MPVNGKSRRSYRGAPVPNTLKVTLNAGATTITLTTAMVGWSTDAEPFFVVVDPGTSKEEKICVKYASADTLTVVDPDVTSTWGSSVNGRHADNTTDREHLQGAVIYPVFTATEANQANELVSKYANAGSVVYQGSGTPGTFTELAIGTANQVLSVNSGATAPEWGKVVNANVSDSAGIVDTKLATIATAGKVSNSATTAASANTASAIVARDGSGNFTAGTITASLFSGPLTGNVTGTASGNLTSGGALGTPSSGTLTNCTFPTLNQNTTGSAGSVPYSGLTGSVPTWNQNTTGNAATATTATTAGAVQNSGTINIGDGTSFASSGAVNIYTPNNGSADIRIESGQNLYLDSGSSTGEATLLRRGGSTVLTTYDNTAAGPKFTGSLYGGGNLGSLSVKWGTVYATNGTIQTSDARLKTDITDSTLGLDFIEKLRPVHYKWIDGGPTFNPNPKSDDEIILGNTEVKRLHFGLIAQEVKQAVDESGVEDFGGWVLEKLDDPESSQGLNYGEFVSPLIKAVQELSAKVSTLEARITQLENQ